MKYLKYFESIFDENAPTPIDIPIENKDYEVVGSVDGVIHYTIQFVNNWIYKEGIALSIDVNSIEFPVAILKNLNINEEYRNQGYGNDGMRLFLDATFEANSILLMADIGEINDFDLTSWYEGYGFEKIGRAGEYPIMMLKNENMNESTYTYSDDYEFEEDSIDYRDGQHDMFMYMRLKDNKQLLAQIDFTLYKDEVSIKFIKSIVKGKGYGEMLMKEFAKKYKYEDIDVGGMTEQGAKLKKKLDTFYNYDYEKHMDSKNKHLSKDVILKIECPYIRQFLNNLVYLGYEKAWEILIASDNYVKMRNEYDLNDIAEIAAWIKGSLSNDNFPQYSPPEHVLDLLNKIC